MAVLPGFEPAVVAALSVIVSYPQLDLEQHLYNHGFIFPQLDLGQHLYNHGFIFPQLDLGQHLYPCFSGPTKIPCTRINLKTGRGSFIEISTAEAGTIQLEFRDLARSANQPKFEVRLLNIGRT